MEQAERVLKRDGAGRVWTPREQREAALDEFERSGMPATQFAAQIGVKYPTFAAWAQKRRQQRCGGEAAVSAEPAALRWVEATMESPEGVARRGLVVHLPGGASLEVLDAGQAELAAHLLRALGGGGIRC